MNKLINYIKESKTELKKVVWPTKKETFNYTMAVVAISLILAAFIGIADYILTLGVQNIIK